MIKLDVQTDNKFDDKYTIKIKNEYPELVDYLMNVRGYSRDIVTEMYRVITKLHAIGFSDSDIINEDSYKLADTIRLKFNLNGQRSMKRIRATLNRLSDYYKWTETICL